MTPDELSTELLRAEDAAIESDEQLRRLVDLIDKPQQANSGVNASDCAKIVRAALDLNERLREREKEIRNVIRSQDLMSTLDKNAARFKAGMGREVAE